MDRWTDKLILVAEASSEIGRCIVVELSKYPLKIVALTSRIALTQELANELRSATATIYPVHCDLTKESDILRAFEWIHTSIGQGVSVMINNANTFIKSQILDGEINDWQNMFNLNFFGAVACCRESCRSMKKYNIDDGHIININSTAGHAMLPIVGQKMYNAVETSMVNLTEGLRHEIIFTGSKIKVTSISPGKINVENNWNLEKYKESAVVMMKPERVASMVVVTLTTPPDIVIAELIVLSVGESIQEYPIPIIQETNCKKEEPRQHET